MRKEFSRIAAVFAVGVVTVVPFSASFAQSGEEVITLRRATMKELGAHAKAINDFLKGDSDPKKAVVLGTIGDMELRAQSIASIAGRIPALFPAGTGLDKFPGKKTGAKPEIWTDRAAFEAAAAGLKTRAEAVEKAAASEDKQALAAALAAMSKDGCGTCHNKFREKL